MEQADRESVDFLRRSGLSANLLARMVRCDRSDVELALADGQISDGIRNNFPEFKSHWHATIAAYAEGWKVLTEDPDEVWQHPGGTLGDYGVDEATVTFKTARPLRYVLLARSKPAQGDRI